MASNIDLNNLQPIITITSQSGGIKEAKTEASSSFGAKFDNLLRLQELIKDFDNVVVPTPIGVSSEEVHTFLKEKAPLFFEHWSALKAIYQESPSTFLNNQKVDQLITELKTSLTKAFTEFPSYWSEKFVHLEDNVSYMVRSSGNEDGDFANAGGNLSTPPLSKEEIIAALPTVIGSYFDKKSFSQQISLNRDPFINCPLSAFIQEVIGEPSGGETNPRKIPTSAVLFTNEPSYVDDKFRFMKISATKGHGEAVVGQSGMGVDSFYLIQSGENKKLFVVNDIADKPERLALSGHALVPLENPEEFVSAPSIDEKMLESLFNLGVHLEEAFGLEKPLDIELIIKEGKIYLVQARPINRAPAEPPQYLETPTSNFVSSKVLVPAHMSAFVLEEESSVLKAVTLKEAEEKYQKGVHKAVIVQQDEPSNSHPTINFSEKNIPVFYYKGKLSPLLEGESYAFCPQTGVIAKGDKDSFRLTEGIISHPASIKFSPSTPLPTLKPAQESTEEVRKLLLLVQTSKTKGIALEALESLQKRADLQILKRHTFKKLPFSAEAERVTSLAEHAFEALKTSPSSLEKAFFAKALNVLMSSVSSLSKMADSVEKAAEKGVRDLLKQAATPCITEEIQTQWENFLKEAEATVSERALGQFNAFLDALGEDKPLWITLSFCSTTKKEAKTIILEALQGIEEATLSSVKKLKTKPFSYFKSEEFFALFKSLSPQLQLVALSEIQKAINREDAALKNIKTSSSSPAEKGILFQSRLKNYYTVMESFITHLVANPMFNLQEKGIQTYFTKLTNKATSLLSSEVTEESLAPSPNFDVRVSIIKGALAVERHLPQTLEDLFTLTHQNLLTAVNALYLKNFSETDISFPEPLHSVHEKMLQLGNGKSELVEVIQESEALILKYNIPLRNHSSNCEIRFEKGEVVISVQMLGQARSRWEEMQNFSSLLEKLNILKASSSTMNSNCLNISWELENGDSLETIYKVIDAIHYHSLGGTFSESFETWLVNEKLEEAYKHLDNPEVASLLSSHFSSPSFVRSRLGPFFNSLAVALFSLNIQKITVEELLETAKAWSLYLIVRDEETTSKNFQVLENRLSSLKENHSSSPSYQEVHLRSLSHKVKISGFNQSVVDEALIASPFKENKVQLALRDVLAISADSFQEKDGNPEAFITKCLDLIEGEDISDDLIKTRSLNLLQSLIFLHVKGIGAPNGRNLIDTLHADVLVAFTSTENPTDLVGNRLKQCFQLHIPPVKEAFQTTGGEKISFFEKSYGDFKDITHTTLFNDLFPKNIDSILKTIENNYYISDFLFKKPLKKINNFYYKITINERIALKNFLLYSNLHMSNFNKNWDFFVKFVIPFIQKNTENPSQEIKGLLNNPRFFRLLVENTIPMEKVLDKFTMEELAATFYRSLNKPSRRFETQI